MPEVFAEFRGDGLFAKEGELFQGVVVLVWNEVLVGLDESRSWKGGCTFRVRVRE